MNHVETTIGTSQTLLQLYWNESLKLSDVTSARYVEGQTHVLFLKVRHHVLFLKRIASGLLRSFRFVHIATLQIRADHFWNEQFSAIYFFAPSAV